LFAFYIRRFQYLFAQNRGYFGRDARNIIFLVNCCNYIFHCLTIWLLKGVLFVANHIFVGFRHTFENIGKLWI